MMDAGVGCVVAASAAAAGMRAAHAAAAAAPRPGSARREGARLAALTALGVGRAAFAAAAGYQVHVGEYGAHWNFFLTLAALRVLALAVPRRVAASPAAAGALGLAALACHQWLLSGANWIQFVHDDHRGAGLISANKEGIFSLPGYFALQLLAFSGGGFLQRASSTGKPAGALATAAALCWAAYWASATALQPVSRRACNATYVLWVLALSAHSVAAFAVAQALAPATGERLPRLLRAVNGAMLPTFLAANLLTGAVNMSADTLAASDWAARGAVAAYAAAVCGAALALERAFGSSSGGGGSSADRAKRL
jgi:phosphatidylinositol glycan class W